MEKDAQPGKFSSFSLPHSRLLMWSVRAPLTLNPAPPHLALSFLLENSRYSQSLTSFFNREGGIHKIAHLHILGENDGYLVHMTGTVQLRAKNAGIKAADAGPCEIPAFPSPTPKEILLPTNGHHQPL